MIHKLRMRLASRFWRTAEPALMHAGYRRFRFACGHCGEPWAMAREPLVDAHGGSTITCGDCGGRSTIDTEPA